MSFRVSDADDDLFAIFKTASRSSQPTQPATSPTRQLPTPPEDQISSLTYSPTNPTRLLVSSWDSYVHLYDTHNGVDHAGERLTRFAHAAPVLDCCYGDSDGELFSGCLDWTVNKLDPETGKTIMIGQHQNSISTIAWNKETKSLISGSWDKTVKLFDSRASVAEAALSPQPYKVYALSTVGAMVVVAMSNRRLNIYDVRKLSEPLQERESSLKFQTRTVECMPNGLGYASSSIEGRVAVEFFDPSDESQARKYAFKCHRQLEEATNTDVVYPVNALAFHPVYGTFASGGGDGVVSVWDGMAKRRLRQYPRFPASVADLSFNKDGKYLAIGTSSGFEDGDPEGKCPPESVKLYVRELAEGEGKGKNQ